MSEDTSKDHRSQASNYNVQMPDFAELWKELYFSNESEWARVLKGFIGTETFVNLLDKTLEQYLAYNKVTRQQLEKISEKGISPTKKDIARVAELVISMEEKIDMMEYQFFDNFKKMTDSMLKMADYQEKLTAKINLLNNEINAMQSKLDSISKKINKPGENQTVKKQAPTERKGRKKKTDLVE